MSHQKTRENWKGALAALIAIGSIGASLAIASAWSQRAAPGLSEARRSEGAPISALSEQSLEKMRIAAQACQGVARELCEYDPGWPALKKRSQEAAWR